MLITSISPWVAISLHNTIIAHTRAASKHNYCSVSAAVLRLKCKQGEFMMGHYDEQYAARELAHLNEKRKRQKARLDKLHDINATVGFGEGDGDNTLVEKEIVK